ncbi:hypothetical protein [Actinomycetospora aeridis]|uniref:Uncharacterized protein n=1 Tax=Actinomycetospora aeridis TaxID=3129231 RepID=A0ABU8NBF5_9PSEU
MWNSLEIVKLVVGALTPLLVVGLGVFVTRAVRRLEDAQWANRKVVERRLELYDKMAPLLNDILCFFTAIGHFRDIDPPALLAKKRELDKHFFVNEYLMSEAFAQRYKQFIETCFRHYTGVGKDAEIRMEADYLRDERGAAGWVSAWDDYFADPAEVAEEGLVEKRYRVLMETFSEQVGVRPADADRART